MTKTWKNSHGVPTRESYLQISDTLKLRVYQTTLRSEISDRKFAFSLYQTIDGMRSCIWSTNQDITCDDMAQAQQKAMAMLMQYLNKQADKAISLRDMAQNAFDEIPTPHT